MNKVRNLSRLKSKRLDEWLTNTWLRLKALWWRQLHRDPSDEVAFHLAMREKKNRNAGMDANEARYAALRAFGSTSYLNAPR